MLWIHGLVSACLDFGVVAGDDDDDENPPSSICLRDRLASGARRLQLRIGGLFKQKVRGKRFFER